MTDTDKKVACITKPRSIIWQSGILVVPSAWGHIQRWHRFWYTVLADWAVSYMHSWDLRTTLDTFFLNCSLSSRHSFAASKLAALSSFGEESIDMIDTMIVSTYKEFSHFIPNLKWSRLLCSYLKWRLRIRIRQSLFLVTIHRLAFAFLWIWIRRISSRLEDIEQRNYKLHLSHHGLTLKYVNSIVIVEQCNRSSGKFCRKNISNATMEAIAWRMDWSFPKEPQLSKMYWDTPSQPLAMSLGNN